MLSRPNLISLQRAFLRAGRAPAEAPRLAASWLILIAAGAAAVPLPCLAQAPVCAAVGSQLRCGVALTPPTQRPVAPAGPVIVSAPPLQPLGMNVGGLSESLRTIGGGLQRTAEQRRQAAFSLILSGRCAEAEAYALKTGDADLTARVQGACSQPTP